MILKWLVNTALKKAFNVGSEYKIRLNKILFPTFLSERIEIDFRVDFTISR